jgi:hypothetical protein
MNQRGFFLIFKLQVLWYKRIGEFFPQRISKNSHIYTRKITYIQKKKAQFSGFEEKTKMVPKNSMQWECVWEENSEIS